MDKETELIKNLILMKYKSIRQFSETIKVPHTTIHTALNKGIGGTAVETVIKICQGLNITIDDLINQRFDNILTPELQELVNNAKHLSPQQLQKLNEFIDTLKKN